MCSLAQNTEHRNVCQGARRTQRRTQLLSTCSHWLRLLVCCPSHLCCEIPAFSSGLCSHLDEGHSARQPVVAVCSGIAAPADAPQTTWKGRDRLVRVSGAPQATDNPGAPSLWQAFKTSAFPLAQGQLPSPTNKPDEHREDPLPARCHLGCHL